MTLKDVICKAIDDAGLGSLSTPAALTSKNPERYELWIRFRKQAEELDDQARRAEHWEAECELTRQAAARILERASEVAEGG